MLLLVGTLSGWLGTARQTPGAQEIAKDLISEEFHSIRGIRTDGKRSPRRAWSWVFVTGVRAPSMEARITFDDALLRLGDFAKRTTTARNLE